MSINYPQSGEYATAEYQTSALPYLTSSVINLGQIHSYEFPFVTRFIDIANRGISSDVICLSFTENGFKTGNYVSIDGSATVNEEVRTTKLYVSCSSGTNVKYQLLCGLTTIPERFFLPVTGSNGHPGVG